MKRITVGSVAVAVFAAGVAFGCIAKEPAAVAQGTSAGQDSKGAPMLLATGGSTANTNDIAWVLTTDTFEDPRTREKVECKVLLCYRVGPNGQFMDIVDVRNITWDTKFKQLPVTGHNRAFTPDEFKKEWDQTKKRLDEEAKKK